MPAGALGPLTLVIFRREDLERGLAYLAADFNSAGTTFIHWREELT